jgi:predicted nucleotidyltransferase
VLTKQEIDRLRQIFLGGPRIRLAVVFGSRARGTAHATSDLDVAILPHDPALSLTSELELQRRLEMAWGTSVDLVRLDRASTLVRWAVARDAQLVLADPASEFPRFRASAALEHADFMSTLGPAAEHFRERLGSPRQASAGRGTSP